MFISIPLALKAIISGAIMSFARALGEFGATTSQEKPKPFQQLFM